MQGQTQRKATTEVGLISTPGQIQSKHLPVMLGQWTWPHTDIYLQAPTEQAWLPEGMQSSHLDTFQRREKINFNLPTWTLWHFQCKVKTTKTTWWCCWIGCVVWPRLKSLVQKEKEQRGNKCFHLRQQVSIKSTIRANYIWVL